MEVSKKLKTTDIKTGDNSNISINNSHNKKWTKTKITTSLAATLTFTGLTGSTGYLLHSNSELNTKLDYILNTSTKWVIIELQSLLDNFEKYPKEIIRAKLETIKNFLANIDKSYSKFVNVDQKITEIERKLKNEN